VNLAGRVAELQELYDAAVGAAADRRGWVGLVGGKPGIGKTRLATAFAAQLAKNEFVHAWVSCPEDDAAPPFWVWDQLLDQFGAWEHAGQRYFDGEVEPCINGRTIETGAYFAVDVSPLVDRILGERLGDGGWNCEAENGSVRSSFDTTLTVLDGLLEFERATGGSGAVRAARRSGEGYLLDRSLFRRQSTGEVVNPEYLDFAFPYYWHYDVLRALDYFRRSGADPDARLAAAVEAVRSKRQPDGRWLLDRVHPGRVHFAVEASVGEPSRWNTLRALRVLSWWEGCRSTTVICRSTTGGSTCPAAGTAASWSGAARAARPPAGRPGREPPPGRPAW
jgi:hypothetical protein